MADQEFKPVKGCVFIGGCAFFSSSVSHVVLPNDDSTLGTIVMHSGGQVEFGADETEAVLRSLGMITSERRTAKSLADLKKNARAPRTIKA